MKVTLTRHALAVVAGVLAAAIDPPPSLTPSAWAAAHLIVPDGEFKGRPFDAMLTPYLLEPMDMLGPDSTVNEIAVKKSAQTGFTLMMLGAIGHSIDRDPCDMMVVQPTDSTLSDFNSQKLNRMIELTPVLRRKVEKQTARAGKASTTYEKKFGISSLVLAIATSAPDLSSKTIKKAFCDEVDRYPPDLDEQGAPLDLVDGRQKTFKSSGTWKRAYVSTPTVEGESEIDTRYLAGDQRKWHIVCPGCATEIAFEFEHLRFNKQFPFKAYYAAQCCGAVIESHQRDALVRAGRWIATAPGPGKYPSYHFDEMSSPFVPWDVIAAAAIGAEEGGEHKLRAFYNLSLGRSYKVRGDAPSHERLMALREQYHRERIPPLGLLLTGAADVQANAIYYEIIAHAPDRSSWVIDAGILDGDTSDHRQGAWVKLAEIYDRMWPDSFDGSRRVDLFGVDSGFRAHVVYAFCRERSSCFATKGGDGWSRPALGTPSTVDLDLYGKKVKDGAIVYTVGTWSLKAQFYSDLRKQRMAEGAPLEPPGCCHFGDWLSEEYFRQLTNERLDRSTIRGRARSVWKEIGPNHWLDCRIINNALADYLGLTRMTSAEWARLAKMRGCPAELTSPDLFAPAPVKVAASEELAPVASAPSATAKTVPQPRPLRRSMQSTYMN